MTPLTAEEPVRQLIPRWLEQGLTSDTWLLLLFVLFVLEGAYLLYVFPSELLVPAALILVGDTVPEAAIIVAIAVFGATIGQTALFLIVRRIGRDWLLQTKWVPVTQNQLHQFEAWFDRYGLPAVAGTNALLFVRGTMTFPAGLSETSLRQFVLYSLVGTVIFECALALLYYAGVLIIF